MKENERDALSRRRVAGTVQLCIGAGRRSGPNARRRRMTTAFVRRDYSLVGPEAEKAAEAGLVSAKWYSPPIPRPELKALMRRDDQPAIRDTLIWFAALIVSGGLGFVLWGSWAAVPFFLIYGVLYGSASDSRWHECGHRTAFKTQWMNDAVYQIACFMILREPEIWRWSHTRHHTDTIIVGRDPEMTFVPDSERGKVYKVARIWLAVFAAVIAACVATWSILPAMFVGLPT